MRTGKLYQGFLFDLPSYTGDLSVILSKCKQINRGRLPEPFLVYHRGNESFILNILQTEEKTTICATQVGFREGGSDKHIAAEIKFSILQCFGDSELNFPTYLFDQSEVFIARDPEEELAIQIWSAVESMATGHYNSNPVYSTTKVGYPSVIIKETRWSKADEGNYVDFTIMSLKEAKEYFRGLHEQANALEQSLAAL